MPRAEKQDIVGNRNATRQSHSPYNQSNRKAKMMSTRSWSPSIWNVLTFWKSGNMSYEGENEEEDHEDDMSTDHDESNASLNYNNTMPSAGEGDDHDMSPFNTSTLSEEQVLANLTRSPRHVHFQLPSSDQERLNNHHSQSNSETPVRDGSHRSYVAPLPPSSPLRQPGSPKDPLAKVSEYIDNVLRPRGGECTDVEALGLSMLIQSSVNQSGKQHGTPSDVNPFLLPKMNSGPSFVSPSPSSVRPMFTSPSTDIEAVLAYSSGASGSPSAASPSNTSPPSRLPPSRTLSQNPNGSLYYQGGGSARSRYRSSTFASPGRNNSSFSRHFGEGKNNTIKVNGTIGTPSPSDGKRRRVGEDRDASIAQASGSRTIPPNETSTPPRTTIPPMPAIRFGTSSPASRLLASTPVRPSPLRQSMRADSSSPGSSSPGSANGGSPRSRASNDEGEGRSRASEKASEIMAGIIKDATPKKDSLPDLRNPYQPSSRSPTKRGRKAPTNSPRPPPPRPTRQSNGTSPTSQSKKLSALETIQITAPQTQTGAKRSHAGMHFPAPPSVLVNGIPNRASASQPGSSADKPVIIELDDDGEEQQQEPPAKKQKSDRFQFSQGTNMEVKPKAQINVDDEDVDMAAATDNISQDTEAIELSKGAEPQETQTQQQETKRPIFIGPFTKGVATTRFHSAPKEPSPLRQSFQPDMPPSPPEKSMPVGKASSPLSAFPQMPAPSPVAQTITPSPFASASAPSPIAQTSALSPFASTSTTSPFAQAFAPSPFASASASSPFAQTSTLSPFTSTSAPTALAQTIATSPFASTSAPSSFASTSSPSSFVQASTLPAVTVTAPSPFGSTSTSPFRAKSVTSPFHFSSVPAKDDAPPSLNDATPVPVDTSVPTPSTSTPPDTASAYTETATDWVSLARKKVLEVPVSSLPTFAFAFTGSMSLFEFSDQRDAALAVPINELPKFDFVDKAVEHVPTPDIAPKVEVKAFDWAAAGMKRPANTGWTCGTCSCQNTEGSSKCVVCDEAKSVPVPTTTGFDWAAAGIKPPLKTGWTCGVCSCQNIEGLSKCSVCGEDKS